ncbi:MAG: PilT/PilU family type 4a pilus ATPase [Candidatus Abyssobacteria bacterium SURF_17]|uniref:PilT/PilU family type 4a pilus ATPase n=1 Tax=Candidatus Abyssobacteria bacterium SURF_17 TaxID=2093361 RepID=A0A419EZ11_9BACT|nr:MAG: PilT/PilU family type 4a pilus ATPase [Candidatus Abyssubacteria bacterium SURF_17]
MAAIDSLLVRAKEMRASDVHLCSKSPPMTRLYGNIVKMEGFDVRTPQLNERELLEVMTEAQLQEFDRHKEIDFSYAIHGVGRFRVNIHQEERGISGAFRIIPSEIRSADSIGLPEVVKEVTRREQGLFLVTGPSGCGKSTTLAALVDLINHERACHVVTIEDPIEFQYVNDKAYVDQREVGTHTRTFASALRSVVRENPDVIVVGEMRDLETISLAVSAAETGHLVFSTLHTRGAAKTVERIINVFPPEQQFMMRTMLGESLVGVLSQQLMRNRAGDGMVLAIEVMINTPAVASLIRHGDTYRVPSAMQTGKKFGMQIMDEHIIELLRANKIDPKVAQVKIEDKGLLREYLQEQQKEGQKRKKGQAKEGA